MMNATIEQARELIKTRPELQLHEELVRWNIGLEMRLRALESMSGLDAPAAPQQQQQQAPPAA